VLKIAADIKELCDKVSGLNLCDEDVYLADDYGISCRGTVYSSRPEMFVFGDIIFHGVFIATCPYNDVTSSTIHN
jgi:hypothetical protein